MFRQIRIVDIPLYLQYIVPIRLENLIFRIVHEQTDEQTDGVRNKNKHESSDSEETVLVIGDNEARPQYLQ